MKHAFRLLLWCVFLFALIVIAVDKWVTANTKGQVYSSVTEVPQKKVGLLLGTSKYTHDSTKNLFYKYRIDATVALYNAGKIKYELISGDNSRADYSEPEMMKADLLARGIPAEKIFLDFAGFRTLDSIVRCKLVFGENDILVISQRFHNERAIFLANKKDITAVGYNAEDVPEGYAFKTMLREKLARVKMLVDLLIGKEPKYLGEKVSIH